VPAAAEPLVSISRRDTLIDLVTTPSRSILLWYLARRKA